MRIIALDIGGGKTLGAVFDSKKNKLIVDRTTRTTGVKELFALIDELLTFSTPHSPIGIAFAGMISENRIRKSARLSRFPANLAQVISKRYGRKAVINNDARCFGFTERTLGSLKGKENGMLIAIGSGLGSCIYINDELHTGAHNFAAEAGHMIIADGIRSRKEFEDIAARNYFIEKGVKPREVEEAARHGNARAKKMYERFGENLGLGMLNLIYVLDPEMIVIGGGMAHASDLFLPSAKRFIKKNSLNPKAASIKIVRSRFYRNGAAIGAALLAAGK